MVSSILLFFEIILSGILYKRIFVRKQLSASASLLAKEKPEEYIIKVKAKYIQHSWNYLRFNCNLFTISHIHYSLLSWNLLLLFRLLDLLLGFRSNIPCVNVCLKTYFLNEVPVQAGRTALNFCCGAKSHATV